jgi:uncharacterized membrane protein
MKGKTFRITTALISMVLAMIVSWSIISGNVIVPLIAVVLAIGLTYFLRRTSRDVTKDERTILLYEKAAGATIRVCVPLAALIAFIFFIFRESFSLELVSAGYALAYTACFLLIVHSAFYSYFSRKF